LLGSDIKLAFDEEGIEISFPQQTVWHKPAAPAQR
jgi:small-conductance mechanosensitive channel